MTLLIFISVIAAVSLVAYYFRFTFRDIYHGFRIRRVGGLVWYQIHGEGRQASDRGEYTIHEMGYLKTLLQSLTQQFRFTWLLERGMFEAVWVKNPNTGMIDLFIGISKNHDGDGKLAGQIASDMGASAKKLSKDPNFPNKAPLILWRKDNKFGNVQNQNLVVGKGHVATALSKAWDDLGRGESAAVFLSLEQVRDHESAELRSYIMNSTVQEAGQFASAPSLADKSAIISEGFRACIASANTRGSESLSTVSLNATDGALGTSGWKVGATRPNEKQAVTGTIIGAAISVILFPLAFIFSGANWGTTLVASLPPLLVGVSGYVLSDFAYKSVFEKHLAKGELPIPPYVNIGNVSKMLQKNRNMAKGSSDDKEETKVRFAIPAPKQVLYLHFSPVFEFLSFPERGDASSDIQTDLIQNLGLPSSMEEYDPQSIYLGQSGKNQVVTYDVNNLVYNLFAGGAPSSGKTNFLHDLYIGIVHYGLNNNLPEKKLITPIWGETKGPGAYDIFKAIRRSDARPIFIDFNNPNNRFKLRLEGRSIAQGATIEEVNENVTNFVTGIQAAWGDSVRGASRDALYAYILIAMLMMPKHIEYLGLGPKYDKETGELIDKGAIDLNDINVIDLAYLLTGADSSYEDLTGRVLELRDSILGKKPDRRTKKMEDVFSDPESYGTTRDNDLALAKVISGYSNRFFTSAGLRDSRSVITSVQNKLSDLKKLPNIWINPEHDMWEPLSFSDFIGSGRPVIANMGGYVIGIDEMGAAIYKNVDTSLSRRVINIFNYLLWTYIRQNCNGWQKIGRYTPIFFDEALDVAQGADSEDVPDVLQQCTKEGRSYGAAFFLGAQSLKPLPVKTQAMVLGFRSKLWFNMHAMEDLQIATSDLNSSSNTFENQVTISPSNIRHLPNGSAMGIIAKGNSVTPPFTLYVPYYETWAKAMFKDGNEDLVSAITTYLQEKGKDDIASEKEIDYGNPEYI